MIYLLFKQFLVIFQLDVNVKCVHQFHFHILSEIDLFQRKKKDVDTLICVFYLGCSSARILFASANRRLALSDDLYTFDS